MIAADATSEALALYHDFERVLDLIREKRDMTLLVDVENHLRLVHYTPGRIAFEPGPAAPPDLAARLASRLQGWTGARWAVSVSAGGGAPTISEARAAARQTREAQALENPLVQAVMAAFPHARIAAFRDPEPAAETDPDASAAMPPEEWDPFEDD